MPGRKSMLAVRFFCISESVAGQPAFGAKHSDTVHEIDRDRHGYAIRADRLPSFFAAHP